MKIMMCPASNHLYLKLLRENLEEEGIEIVDVSWFGKQFPYSSLQFLKGKIEGSDILHFHWMPFNRFFMMKAIRKLSEKLNIKMVWTIHNLLPHLSRYGSIEKDKEAMKYMADWASVGIVHCEKTKEEFYEMYGIDLPLFVIPHGNFNEYVDIKDPTESREKLNISEDKIVLLMVPPNRWTKGIKTFIKVINRLPNNYLGILAGRCNDNTIKEYIMREYKKNPDKFLVNLEYISKEEIGYYFAASDIFFMPYEKITTSGSVIYAMGFKKPIISTPKGNLYQLVKNGVNGFLCGTKEEMIEKIMSIDRDKARKMGEKSYEIAKRFDWKEIAKRTVEVYKWVMKK